MPDVTGESCMSIIADIAGARGDRASAGLSRHRPRCGERAALDRQTTAPGAHAILTDPSNRFAFVPHIARQNDNVLEPPKDIPGARRACATVLAVPLSR